MDDSRFSALKTKFDADGQDAEAVVQICRTLCVAGNRGFVVGGAVRDALRGAEITDFDLATTAPPQKMLELFPKVIPTGIKHGTVTVMSKGRTT